MRIALYARVSKRVSTQDTENQLIQLREYCARQGWTIIHEYIDRRTGKNSDRVEYQHMFTDASQRRFDAVLVWALDRMTREGVPETFSDIRRLTQSGVQFMSFTEEHFRTTGPAGELMIAVAAWIAKQERVRIAERVTAGLDRARKQGRIGGRPKLIINRQRILDLHAEGKSIRAIEAALNGEASRSFIHRCILEGKAAFAA